MEAVVTDWFVFFFGSRSALYFPLFMSMMAHQICVLLIGSCFVLLCAHFFFVKVK